MNKLPEHKRTQILHMLVEGVSMRSISRVVDVSINTVTKLLVDSGTACSRFHNEYMKGIESAHIECDEIWAFCYAKKGHLDNIKGKPLYAGDVWTWTAMDTYSRLIVTWMATPGRETKYAIWFLTDLCERLAWPTQISTDGLGSYLEGIKEVFGEDADYAQIIKEYGKWKYITRVEKKIISGEPDLDLAKTIYMERHNLTTRMSIRRYMRQVNAFSKKIQNHCHALALYFVYYNFCRKHSSLVGMTPAMIAGIANEPYSLEWILDLIDSDGGKSN